jgi:glycerol-3-phosphate acyltransferase PlsY
MIKPLDIALIITAFLLGSIPFGMLLARQKGVDLRKTGSGNIGATNVLRSVGKGTAILTLLGDILKGTGAVAFGRLMGADMALQGALAVAAVTGHDFSVFLRFRGGKGVATSIGVMLLYAPKAGMLTVLLWLATVILSRYSSLGALISFGLLPLGAHLLGYSSEVVGVSVILAVLLYYKHAANIQRLLKGTEQRIGQRA